MKGTSSIVNLNAVQHQLTNARPAQLIGWLLSVIGIVIGLAGVVGASPAAQDGIDTARRGASSISSGPHTRPVTVEQGMRISTASTERRTFGTSLQFCTLGYIDHARGIGYTSAHCVTGADEGTYQPGGVPITTRDQRLIGTAYPHMGYAGGDRANGHDIAVIVFSDNVTLGANRYSGDTIIDPADIDRDTARFCTYGATTQRVQCGNWDPKANHAADNEFFTLGTNTIDGDSGSAVWVTDAQGNPQGLYGISRGRGRYADNRPNAVGVIANSIDISDFEDGIIPAP